MEYKEMTIGDFNPDGMSAKELQEWAHSARGLRPITKARKFFHNIPDKRIMQAYKDLRAYAWNKSTAMLCRERGDVPTALSYEKICDRIYDELPEFAKW